MKPGPMFAAAEAQSLVCIGVTGDVNLSSKIRMSHDRGTWEQTMYANLLRNCGIENDLVEGNCIHARILASEHRENRYLANLLVQMYGKCGDLEAARLVFDAIQEPNVYSWNIMLAMYSQNGYLEAAKSLFDRMPNRDIVTWNAMIAAYAQNGHLDEAKSLLDIMPNPNVVSWTTMLQAYAECGYLERARHIFERMPKCNVISWTAMLQAYAQNGHLEEAKSMFDRMPKQSTVTWTAIIRAYALNGYLEEAKSLFDRMPKRDVVAWTVMITAFGENGHLERAKVMFESMPEQNVVSWTAMIAAYAQNMHLAGAKSMFDVMPDRNVVAWTAMIAAFAHSMQVKEARLLFDSMPDRNVVSWNAMMSVYAHFGHSKEGIELFHAMRAEGLDPDEISFLSVLNACSHIGQVDQGWQFFIFMTVDHGISPWREHYCCMVDILGRAGQLRNAEDLIHDMPFVPNAVAWAALLGGSRIHSDVDRGAHAAKEIFQLDPKNAAPYVLLANIYAAVGRDEDADMVRKIMKDRDVMKLPPISLIKVQHLLESQAQIKGAISKLRRFMELT